MRTWVKWELITWYGHERLIQGTKFNHNNTFWKAVSGRICSLEVKNYTIIVNVGENILETSHMEHTWKELKLYENGFLSDPPHNGHYNIHVNLPQTYMTQKIYIFHFNYYQILAKCLGFHCISLLMEKLYYSKASTIVPVGCTSGHRFLHVGRPSQRYSKSMPATPYWHHHWQINSTISLSMRPPWDLFTRRQE